MQWHLSFKKKIHTWTRLGSGSQRKQQPGQHLRQVRCAGKGSRILVLFTKVDRHLGCLESALPTLLLHCRNAAEQEASVATLHLVPLLLQAETATWMWEDGWLLSVRQSSIVPTSFLGPHHQLPLVSSSQVPRGTHMPESRDSLVLSITF